MLDSLVFYIPENVSTVLPKGCRNYNMKACKDMVYTTFQIEILSENWIDVLLDRKEGVSHTMTTVK